MLNKHIKIKTNRIYSIKEVGEEETYDIQNFQDDCFLKEPNFFADGFLVHNCGKHAGGICILPEPVYNYVPVERVQGVLVTGYQESGQKTDLDELGVIKFDILGISTLDVIKNAVEMIDEEIYLIEEDGIIKAVPESYLKKEEAV